EAPSHGLLYPAEWWANAVQHRTYSRRTDVYRWRDRRWDYSRCSAVAGKQPKPGAIVFNDFRLSQTSPSIFGGWFFIAVLATISGRLPARLPLSWPITFQSGASSLPWWPLVLFAGASGKLRELGWRE